jgi:hypothetical protein
MDYQSWVPVAVTLLIGVYGIILQHIAIARMGPPNSETPSTQNMQTWLPRRPLLIMVLLMMLSWFPFVFSRIRTFQSVSTSNIHSRVDRWMDDFHLARRLRTKDESPNTRFSLDVSIDKDRGVIIEQPSDQPEYITIQTGVILTDVANKTFEKLTASQQAQVKDDLVIAMATLHMSEEITFTPLAMKIFKVFPITPSLTEFDVISAVQDTDSAEMTAMSTVATSIRRYQPALPDLRTTGKIVKRASQ